MPELAEAGYTALWLPPPTKGSGGLSVGYDMWDPFDFGSKDQRGSIRTRYGTEAELLEMVTTAHRFGIRVYFDNIMNHRSFDIPGYNESTPTGGEGQEELYPGMVPEDFHLRKTEDGFYRKWDNTRSWGDAWQVQNLGLSDLIDIAHEIPNTNHGPNEGDDHPKYSFVRDLNRPEQYDKDKDGNTAYFGVLIDQARAELVAGGNANPTAEQIRLKARDYISANRGPFVEDVGAYLIRAVRYKMDRLKIDGLRLDAVKHVPDYFYGQQSGADKDRSDAGYIGGIQRQFNLTRGFEDWDNHRDSVFEDKLPRNDAMVFGEHLGTPPPYGGYWDAGMRLVDNDLRSQLNNRLGNPSSNLNSYDEPGYGGFSPSLGVTHANSHDNDFAAQKEWQHAFYMTREGMGLIYSDGYNKAETLGESGGAFPRHANTAYLGQFNDPRIPNILKIHNDFARGLQQGLWSSSDLVVFERRDNRRPDGSIPPIAGNAADEITMVMMMNDNTSTGVRDDQRRWSSSFPSGAYLYQYATGPNMSGFYKYANEINNELVPAGGYYVFSYRTPELSTLWPDAAITLYQTNAATGQLEEVPRITVTRKDGRDGDSSFNPNGLANRGYPTNATPVPYTYQTTVPVVKAGQPFTILARADGSAENILLKLDGGVDLNSHLGMGDTNEVAKRDHPPGRRTDIWLGYEQPAFVDRQHPEKFAAVLTPRNRLGSPGAETYVRLPGGTLSVNLGPTNGASTNNFSTENGNVASWIFHDPTNLVGGPTGTAGVGNAQLDSTSGPNLTLWAKTPTNMGAGYRMFVYYTAGGNSYPEGAGGLGRGETRVAEMNFRHNQTTSDTGSWWSATNLPGSLLSTEFRYKIGVYRTEKTTNTETPSWWPGNATAVAYKEKMLTTFRVDNFNPSNVQFFPHNDYARTPTLGATYSNWPFAMQTGLSEGFHVLRARAFLPTGQGGRSLGAAPLYNTFVQTFYYDARTPEGVLAFPANQGDPVRGSIYEMVVRTDMTVEEVWYRISDSDNNNDDAVTRSQNGNGIGFEPFVDGNGNGVWNAGETFTDLNGNGTYDAVLNPAWAKAVEVTPSLSIGPSALISSPRQKEWRFTYRNIPLTGTGTVTLRFLEASSSRNFTLDASVAHVTEITRSVQTQGSAERILIGYPASDGETVGPGYVMQVWFPKSLSNVSITPEQMIARFTFSAQGVVQDRTGWSINYGDFGPNNSFHQLSIPLPHLYNSELPTQELRVVYRDPGDASRTSTAIRVVTFSPDGNPFLRISRPEFSGSESEPTQIILPDGPGPDFTTYEVWVQTGTGLTNAPTVTGITLTNSTTATTNGNIKTWKYTWAITNAGTFNIEAEATLSGNTPTKVSRKAAVILRQVVPASGFDDRDDDHDGLLNLDESNGKALPTGNAETWSNGDVHVFYATGKSSPTSPDSDGDGLPDGLEVGWRVAASPPTDTTVDTNGDGRKNFIGDLDPPLYAVVENYPAVPGVGSQSQGDDRARQAAGSVTDPAKPDTDGDGILDGVEDANRNGWTDGDGKPLPLTATIVQYTNSANRPNLGDWPNNTMDSFETWTETSPTKVDSDGDGLRDGLDPTTNRGEDKNGNGVLDGDTDGDRAYDAGEAWTETNPLDADTDKDGLPDGWEVSHDLDPLDNGADSYKTALANDGTPRNGAAGDPDGDGFTNAQELASGTNPIVPAGGGNIFSGEGSIDIGTFTQWTHNDLLVLDEYNENNSNGAADVYRSGNNTDNSRDIVGFSFRDGGVTGAGGDGRLYFRIDFLDLEAYAEDGEVNAYIVIDTGNPGAGERSMPDGVDIATDMRWEVVVRVAGQDTLGENQSALFVDRDLSRNSTTEVQNPVTDGGVEERPFAGQNERRWDSRFDAVEIAIERRHLMEAGWQGDPHTLNFQVFTTKPNTAGDSGDISGRNDIRDTIYDDWLASDWWRDQDNIRINGKLSGFFSRNGANDRNKSAKVMLLAHGNQAIQPASFTQSLVYSGSGSNAVGYARLIQTHKTNNAPLSLHITPTLASSLQWARSTAATTNNLWSTNGPNNDGPTLNQEIRSLIASGKINLIGSSFSDHVPTYFPLDFNRTNKVLAESFLNGIYGTTGSNVVSTNIYWPSERMLDTNTLAMLTNKGYQYTFADQMKHLSKWFGRSAALGTAGYRINQVNGVKIFPIHDETSAYLELSRDGGSHLALRQMLSRRSRSDVQDQVVVLWRDLGDFLSSSQASSYEDNVRWLGSRPWIRVVTAQQIADNQISYKGQDGNTYTQWGAIDRGTRQPLTPTAQDWVDWATGGDYGNWFNRLSSETFGLTNAFGQVGVSGVAHSAANAASTVTNPHLAPLAQSVLHAAMFQTAFHLPNSNQVTDLTKFSTGDYINPASQQNMALANFARHTQSQARFAAVYSHVQTWSQGGTMAQPVAESADVDLDGAQEYLLKNNRVFALFEAIGGRMTAAWLRDPETKEVWQVAGNFTSYSGTDNEDEGAENTVGIGPAMSVSAYRTSGFKDWWAITGGSGSNSSVNASNTVTTNGPAGWTFTQGGIAKTITLPGANTAQIQAQYSLTGPTNLYVRFGLSPDLADLKIRGAPALAPEVTTGSGTNRRSSVSNVREDRIVRAWVRAEGLNPGATDRGTGFTTVDRRNQAQTHQMEVLVTTNPSTQVLTLGFDAGNTNVLTFTPPPKVTYGQTIDLAAYTQSSIEGPVTYNFSLVGGSTNQVRLNGSQLTIDSGTGDVTVRVESPDYPTASQVATIQFEKAAAAITSWTNLNQVEGSTGPVGVVTDPLGLNTVVTYVAVGSSVPAPSSNPPSLPGLYRVTASVEHQNYQASDAKDLTVRSRFADRFNDATANSDTDGDGVPALLEYAFNGSVGANDQSKLPEMNLTNGNLTLTAVVRTDDPTLFIEPVRTTNLGLGLSGWSTNGTSQTNSTNTVGVPAGFQRRIYSTPITNDPRAFLRLQIRTNSPPSL